MCEINWQDFFIKAIRFPQSMIAMVLSFGIMIVLHLLLSHPHDRSRSVIQNVDGKNKSLHNLIQKLSTKTFVSHGKLLAFLCHIYIVRCMSHVAC